MVLTPPTKSYTCKNLLSATRNPEVVSDLLSTEVKNGYVIGPFSEPPFEIYRINPLGIAERKYSHKKRLIVDLSAPHNIDTHQSLNSLIDKSEYSVKYTRIDDAIDVIKRFGVGSVMNKTDVVSGYSFDSHVVWVFWGLSCSSILSQHSFGLIYSISLRYIFAPQK